LNFLTIAWYLGFGASILSLHPLLLPDKSPVGLWIFDPFAAESLVAREFGLLTLHFFEREIFPVNGRITRKTGVRFAVNIVFNPGLPLSIRVIRAIRG
jgi:hypothetical protein